MCKLMNVGDEENKQFLVCDTNNSVKNYTKYSLKLFFIRVHWEY